MIDEDVKRTLRIASLAAVMWFLTAYGVVLIVADGSRWGYLFAGAGMLLSLAVILRLGPPARCSDEN